MKTEQGFKRKGRPHVCGYLTPCSETLCSCVCGKVTNKIFFFPVCTTECNSDCVLNKIQLEIQLCGICDDEKVSLSVT